MPEQEQKRKGTKERPTEAVEEAAPATTERSER